VKLVFVSNCPLPYHTPILNDLADLVDLHVIYMSEEHPSRNSGATWAGFDDRWGVEPQYSHEFYWSRAVSIPRVDFRTQVSVGVSRRLRTLRPDVVLGSGWGPLMIEPVLWTGVSHSRSVMWAESTLQSGLLRGGLSDAVRRAMLARIGAFVSNGTAATAYLHLLGVEEGRIVTSRFPSRLRPDDDALHSATAGQAKTYLFVGRLVPIKRVDDAVRAFTRVLASEPDARLVIAGSGPAEGAIRQAIRGLSSRASVLGRREGAELSRTFLAADVLLLPSEREVWGLVVNEGLAHGLYVVASDEVGAAVDLVTPATGAVYPVRDIDALARAMREAPKASPTSRQRAAASVRSITPAAFAAAIRDASELALGGGGR
jgi:glycosyltransferase involved in cell wall biosynthesis